jgi:hypothetical protein
MFNFKNNKNFENFNEKVLLGLLNSKKLKNLSNCVFNKHNYINAINRSNYLQFQTIV